MISHRWAPDGATGFWLAASPDFPVVVSVRMLNDGVEGMGNPPYQAFTRQTALLDGQTNSGWKAEPREVFWPILIDGDPDTWDDLQTEFWAGMRPNLYGTWTVYKGTGSRYLRCRYVTDGGASYSTDPSRTGAEVHGITLIADKDPWWHTEDVSATFQTAEDPVDFFNGGTAPDFYIMSGNTVASASLENPGDVPAWPTYRIDGPATSFSISTNGSIPDVAGVITVLDGEWLVIDTNPTVQTALLYTTPTNFTDVTNQLSDYTPRQVGVGLSTEFDITLFGEGSLTISLTPSYFRAF